METHSLEEFKKVAREFAAQLIPKSDKAIIVSLSGDLGAGKTTFVQEIARFFGVQKEVKSPTFVLMQSYELAPEGTRGFRRLIHIDAYRLEEPQYIEHVGWSELLKDPKNLIFIEWPEKIPAFTPDFSVTISGEGEERHISLGSVHLPDAIVS